MAGKFFGSRYRQSNQLKRDRRAQLILELARQGQAEPYTLYLRGFRSTGQIPAEATSTIIQEGFDPRESAFVDAEALFSQILESEAPVVALGRSGEQIGAGRIETEDDRWKQDLQILADNALLLLLLPFPGDGIQWEIEWIKFRGLLKKTLFLMPPKRPWFLSFFRRSQLISWAETWKVTRIRLGDLGLSLPSYEDQGMMFFLGDDGTVSGKASLGGWLHPNWVEKRIMFLLNDMSRKLETVKRSK